MHIVNTDCRKCKDPMPVQVPITNGGPFRGSSFKVTAYRCPNCGHWNNLLRRANKASGAQA